MIRVPVGRHPLTRIDRVGMVRNWKEVRIAFMLYGLEFQHHTVKGNLNKTEPEPGSIERG